MRLAAQAKGGYYPTPDRVVDMIAGLIDTPYGHHHYNRETLRILDPCAGAGEAVAQLAEELRHRGNIPVETYGVELHRDRAQLAEERLDRAPRRRPVPDLHSQTGPSASPTSTRPTTGTRRISASNTPSSPSARATWPRAGCWSSSCPA